MTSKSFSISTQIACLLPDERANCEKNLAFLQEVLSRFPGSLTVRDDSKLAWRYALAQHFSEDQANVRAHDVCAEMSVTQLLYSQQEPHANYRQNQQDRLRTLATSVKEAHPSLPWAKVWDEVKKNGTHLVKLAALQERSNVQRTTPS